MQKITQNQFMKLNVKHKIKKKKKIKEKSVGPRARQSILRLDTSRKIHKRKN